jgi:hypothetical protein
MGRDHLGKPEADKKIIKKWILEQYGRKISDNTRSLGEDPIWALMDVGFIKVDNILSSCVVISVSRTLVHVVSKCGDIYKFLNISPWAIKRIRQ